MAKAEQGDITPGSIWVYKGHNYQVSSLMMKNLSQDHELGVWRPTVRYTTYPQSDLVFYRPDLDWLRKFTKVS